MIDKFSYFKFNFSELKVTASEIFPLLGFGPGNNPGPYEQYIDEVLEFANQNVNNISGSLCVSENIEFDTENNKIRVDSLFFDSGKIVTRQLRKCSSVAIFVCTAGPEIEEFSKQQMKIGNIPEGYVADIAGSVIVEAAMDKIQNDFAKHLKAEGLKNYKQIQPWLLRLECGRAAKAFFSVACRSMWYSAYRIISNDSY
ncbi:MAG: hypothetical protein HC905_20755 [Bacteroidales bacterium]|nr:hypothetical protein [Bacteroidales bacterium]